MADIDPPFYTSPVGTFADDLTSFAPGGDPYAGIPDFSGAEFSTIADAPPDSVPAAMAPNTPTLPVTSPSNFPSKDSD